MLSASTVITLLTDFDTVDPFVGVMKGVIYQRCPQAHIVDLTHEIEPQNLRQAGYALADSWRYFPPGTFHVAVVDPGVGTDRAVIAAEVDGQTFIAPDNGLLTAVFEQCPPQVVRTVNNGAIFLKPLSRTFHGRDIFAPTAAALAAGMNFADVGPIADEWVSLDLPTASVRDNGMVHGAVIHVDRFGNLITNITGTSLPLMPRFTVNGHGIVGLARSYAGVAAGEPLAIIGSTGRVEIAVNGGSAAAALSAGVDTPVTVIGRRSD